MPATVTPRDGVPLPDPDLIRSRIDYHVDQANELRRLLRIVLRLVPGQTTADRRTPARPDAEVAHAG